MTCTFFGHKDTPNEIDPMLRSTLIYLIEQKNVRNFYVGNHGSFDRMVIRLLREFKEAYPIKYAVVLAYLPIKEHEVQGDYLGDTVFPEGIEAILKRFAINYRNK